MSSRTVVRVAAALAGVLCSPGLLFAQEESPTPAAAAPAAAPAAPAPARPPARPTPPLRPTLTPAAAAPARAEAALPPQTTPLPQGIQITNTLTVYPSAAGPYPATVTTTAAPPPSVIINTPPSPPPGPAPSPPAVLSAPPPPAAASERAPRVEERAPPSEGRRSGQPAGVKYEHRMRSGLLGSGATLFLLSYGLSVVSAASFSTDCDPNTAQLGCTTQRWPLFVPVAGPFIQMGSLSGTNSGTARALLAVDGVLQAGGAAMALVGLLVPKRVAVPTVFAGRVRFSPLTGAGGSGLLALGTF